MIIQCPVISFSSMYCRTQFVFLFCCTLYDLVWALRHKARLIDVFTSSKTQFAYTQTKTGKTVVALARHLSKAKLQPVFYQACRDLDYNTVTELLRIGGDPFWTDSKGFTCIIMAALSSIDARNKLRVLQSKRVIIINTIFSNQFRNWIRFTSTIIYAKKYIIDILEYFAFLWLNLLLLINWYLYLNIN